MSQLITRYLKISGMDCTACAVNIDLDLEEISGVQSAKTSYGKQQSQITYDESSVSLDKIKYVFQKAGYQVELVSQL